MKRMIANFCLLLTYAAVHAQISGVVTDAKGGKALKDCHVFVNNSSIWSSTDGDGAFVLKEVPNGFVDLVLYKEGYQLFKSSLRIQPGKAYQLNLTLTPVEEKTKLPRSKQDEEWKKDVEWFQQALFGDSEFKSLCKLENIKDVAFERDGDKLVARAEAPLIVLHKALGYRIHYYLQSFVAGVQSVNAQAFICFDTLKAKDYLEQNYWNRNREKAFFGSDRHLFRSLVEGTSSQEGFELLDANGKRIPTDTLVRPSRIESYYNIQLPELTHVRYTVEMETGGMNESGQASVVSKNASVDVNALGVLFNPNAIAINGPLDGKGLSTALPWNYVPSRSIQSELVDWQNFGLLQEKVYIHTDRDYYYPRETIWFKAYLGYSMPILRDTLSRLLYVEFVAPSGEVLITRNVKIRNGLGWGEFPLPQKMNKGEYYIRAYTNWMRNYEDGLYIRPVPILSYDENLAALEESSPIQDSLRLEVTPDQSIYPTRGKVSLSIRALTKDGNPLPADVSISVTDANEAMLIPQVNRINSKGILKVSGIEKNAYFDAIDYYMERGISFTGKVVDDKNKGIPVNLAIVQGNMENLIDMQTDENGEFLVTGLDFYDSLNFAFKPTNDKGKMVGKVKLLSRDVPVFTYTNPKLELEYQRANALQRVQNTYELDRNTIVLEEVVIEDKALPLEEKTVSKIYGEADHIVKGSDLRASLPGTNPLVALQGRVPGLQVVEYFDELGIRRVSVRVRGGTTSIQGNNEPLILVDGMLWSSANDLFALTPAVVDRIEVVTRAVSMYGSRGANGLIAIYTKQGVDAANTPKDYLSHKIGGFTRPDKFRFPDYDKSEMKNFTDLRTTIYWNPNVRLGGEAATVEFFAADLQTRYRIVVEGVTEDGAPLRSVTYLEIGQ